MFRCRLPGKADRVVRGVITVVSAAAQVGLIKQCVLQLVVIVAHLIYGPVVAPVSEEEPQFVLFDRTANPSSNVVILSDRRRALQATRTQFIVQVIADQAGACGLNAR